MTISPADVARDILAKTSGPSYDGDPVHVSAADAARLIRATLKVKFPGVKFSVTSDTYSGGSSIRVVYDGIDHYDPDPRDGLYGRAPDIAVYRDGMPRADAVKAVVDAFGGKGFDGFIDLSYYTSAWLSPDGSVTFAGNGGGTTGSAGSVPAIAVPPPDGAVRISVGSYLFVDAYIWKPVD